MVLRFAPLLEIAVTGPPFREFSRQHAPLTATFEYIRHAAEHFISIHRAWAGLLPCTLQNGQDSIELLSANIARITLAHHVSSCGEKENIIKTSSKDYEQTLRP